MIKLSLDTLINLLRSANLQLEVVLRPNPKYTPNEVERQFSLTRNKIIFFIHTTCFFLFLLDIPINGAPVFDSLVRSCICLTLDFILYLSCRYHPQIFKVTYTFICCTYAPTLIQTGEEGVHSAYTLAPMAPIFQYIFCGDLAHYLFQSVIQIIYLNTIYVAPMEQAVTKMSPEDFTRALGHSTSLVFLINCVIAILVHHVMTQANRRIWAAEKKKIEFENQKVFLLSFSHELRNLINNLAGNVKLASLEESLTVKAKDLLLNAEVCGELLLHLVNNILDTGKVEIGELEVEMKPTKIYDVLERICSICSELIKRKGLRSKIKIHKSLPMTLAVDHYRLTQVILNMVSNAVKFTESGSVDISIEWIDGYQMPIEQCFKPYPFNDADDQDEGLFEKSQRFHALHNKFFNLSPQHSKINKSLVRKLQAANKGILKVIVTDTGCGMAKEELFKLFKKFSQVTTDVSKRKLGTGLGLFISKQLCRKMGGEVKAFSKKDKGSCFIFCLPLEAVQDPNERLVDTEALKDVIETRKLKAMIVDDAPFNHLILTTFLEKLGIEIVDTAINGQEAYDKYVQLTRSGDRPDIVTMDLDMPVMDGKEASYMIRCFEDRNQLRNCFLTIVSGNCTNSEIKDCLNRDGRVKANTFLKKPVSMEELIRAIAQHFVT